MTIEPSASPLSDGADPSMEEILASIRRILNEDESSAASTDAGKTTLADDDVLVLDESMMVRIPEAQPQPEADPHPEPPEPEMAASSPILSAEPKEQLVDKSDLVAPEAAAAAASSVGSLMRTLAAGRATQVYAGGPTLEDLVRAELRPLLKEWLDANLPPVVERLVRAEIERVVGRAVP
jgi:cell pole-organizing protein PopZ